MSPPPRWLRWTLVAAGVVAAGVLVVLVTVPRSDWAHRQVRSRVLDALEDRVNGTVEIGSVRGNLLREAAFEDVVVRDSSGSPVLRAGRLRLGYALGPLLRQRLLVREVELVEPTILLERPPDGEWNVARLFRGDTAAVSDADTAGGGFGSWIRVREVAIRDGSLTARTPWSPPDRLEGTALDSAVAAALSERSRARVERTEGGYQVVRELEELDARLSELVVADPDEPVSGRLDSLSATALPFRPPALAVRQLEGGFSMSDDSVRVRDLRLELPDSRLAGAGAMELESGRAQGRIEVERLTSEDLAWLSPDLPRDGRASLALEVGRTADTVRLHASDLDVRLQDARLRGRAEVFVTDSLSPGATDLRFSEVDTRLVKRLAPGAEIPVEGTAGGRIRLAPDGERARVEGALDFRHRATGAESRVSVDGFAYLPAGDRVEDLRVRLDPLHVSILEGMAGSLPVGGALRGRVTLDRARDGALAADLDVAHRDTTGLTRLVGETFVDAPGPDRRVRANVRAPVLSLATVGRFAPAAGLRGSARASLTATGPLSRPALDLGLAVEGGGAIDVSGSVGLEDATRRYDLRARLDTFDAHAVSVRAPSTRVSGTLSLEGRGTDPADMDAELRADFTEATVDSIGPAGARLEARASDGLVRVDRADLVLASATGRIEGSFGLVSGRSGDLHVEVTVDSLADFADRLPPDTTAFAPRPALQARRIAEARADSLREARQGEVERAATGEPAAPGIEVDTIPPLTRDSLAGSVRLEGTVSGNSEEVDARGRLEFRNVVAFGTRTGNGRAQLSADDLRSPRPSLALDLEMNSVRLGGFAFDSIGGRVEHAGDPGEGEGTASAVVVQDPDRDYRFRVGYSIEVDRRELRLERMALRFDTVRWTSTAPGTIGWEGAGVTVDSVELRTAGEGRILVDGRFTTEEDEGEDESVGAADTLALEVDDLPIAHVVGLVQDTLDVSGLATLRLRATGPPSRARIDGSLTLRRGGYRETTLPEVRLQSTYSPGELAAGVRLLEPRGYGGAARDTLVTADGTAEIDLFGGETRESRSLEASIRADSLPLESIPLFTDAVSDVRGRIRGRLGVEGTLDDPEVEGRVDLDLGQMRLTWPRIELRDGVGAVRVRGDSVRLDSLRVRSGGGTLRLAGTADLAASDGPRLDVDLTADDAAVLNNDIGQNVRIDGEVTVEGPHDGLVVGGRVRVREGDLMVPETREEVVDLESPAVRRAMAAVAEDPEMVPESDPVLRGLRMNVALDVSRNTWVRSNEGTAEIYTPEGGSPLRVRYGGTGGGLVLDGIIHADRGEYRFAGRRFDITTGTATFLAASTIDPLLSLTATHEVPRPGREALAIQIHVGGRLLEPRVTLTSNAEPPLSQTDLISYLVFGTTSASLVQPGSSVAGDDRGLGAMATQQLASLAMGSLVEEAFSSVESRTRGSGLDVFRIEPAELPDELAFEGYLRNVLRGTRFEAGKYLNRRLFLAATGRATSEVWPGFTLEYRTPGGFRLTGAWEPRYLPSLPTFDPELEATRTRELGLFLRWERRVPGRAESSSAEGVAPEGSAGSEPP